MTAGSGPPASPGGRLGTERRWPVRPVTDWPAARQVPTTYPGAAPDHPYLMIDGQVVALAVRWTGDGLEVVLPDGTPVDDLLATEDLAPLAERLPVLAYGSNRSPHTLALKLSHHGGERPGAADAVPVLAGTLVDHDVVAGGLASQGFVYADLAPSPGTRVSVLLTLLDPLQADAVHESEGLGSGAYDCALLPGFEIGRSPSGAGPRPPGLSVLAYAGAVPVFLSPETGEPVAFSAIAAADRRFAALDQVDLFAHVLRTTGAIGAVADVLGLAVDTEPADVASEVARTISGQWWYVHNTGDVPTVAARRVYELIDGVLAGHRAGTSTAARLAAAGAALDPAVVRAAGPELRLGAQVEVR